MYSYDMIILIDFLFYSFLSKLLIDNDAALSRSILGFDGVYLKQAREDALLSASQAPLFSSNYKVIYIY